jgi:hypothetical protein
MLGSFFNDPQCKLFPLFLRQQLGGDLVINTMKYIVNNFILMAGIEGMHLLAASLIMVNPLMWPFAVLTFLFGLMAIDLAQSKA